MAFVPKLFDDIIEDEINYVIANTNKISDFNDGSINKSILGAIAMAIEELYFSAMLGWKSALNSALKNSLDFERLGGTKATGNVQFSRTTPASSDIEIPIGTTISTGDGISFVTTELGTISTGNTSSGNVSIEAVLEGTSGNVAVSTITDFVNNVSGVDFVTNSAAVINGVNEETDDQYDSRFKLYIQGLSKANIQGLKKGALDVVGVKEARVIENQSTPGYLIIYIDDGSGSASSSLISDVIDKIEGDQTEANPGYRPAGIFINYQAAVKVNIDVTAIVYYALGVDIVLLDTDVRNAISGYINSLPIGEDVVKTRIIEAILALEGVVDVSITLPATNTVINVNTGEIAKVRIISLTFTQLSL